jgi:hypothetical protein
MLLGIACAQVKASTLTTLLYFTTLQDEKERNEGHKDLFRNGKMQYY